METERIDVAEVMREIRTAVSARREAGRLTPEDVEQIIDRRLVQYGEEALIDPKLLKRLRASSHEWNISTDYLIRTRRRGMFGRLIVLVKRLVRPWVRLYTDHVLHRQAQLNLYLFYALRDSVARIARLEVEVVQLQRRWEERG